jgi:uncharacterized protein YkwD
MHRQLLMMVCLTIGASIGSSPCFHVAVAQDVFVAPPATPVSSGVPVRATTISNEPLQVTPVDALPIQGALSRTAPTPVSAADPSSIPPVYVGGVEPELTVVEGLDGPDALKVRQYNFIRVPSKTPQKSDGLRSIEFRSWPLKSVRVFQRDGRRVTDPAELGRMFSVPRIVVLTYNREPVASEALQIVRPEVPLIDISTSGAARNAVPVPPAPASSEKRPLYALIENPELSSLFHPLGLPPVIAKTAGVNDQGPVFLFRPMVPWAQAPEGAFPALIRRDGVIKKETIQIAQAPMAPTKVVPFDTNVLACLDLAGTMVGQDVARQRLGEPSAVLVRSRNAPIDPGFLAAFVPEALIQDGQFPNAKREMPPKAVSVGAATAPSLDEKTFLDLVNRDRKAEGLKSVRLEPKLVEAARIHARNMAKMNVMDHVLPIPDAGTLPDRQKRVGYKGLLWENVAYLAKDAKEAHQVWMDSPGHRANILEPSVAEMGVAMEKNSKGELYFCEVFGKRD